MDLGTQIRQQQATVNMLEKLLRAQRVSEQEVDQAKRRLMDLQQQEGFRPVAPRPERVAEPVPVVAPSGRVIVGDEYVALQAELGQQADRLNRQMAELSNTLHQVPTGVGCPELTRPILALKAQIEAVWDKKRYLERNRTLPEEPVAEVEPQTALGPTLEDAGRFELAYEKRRLIDLRSKLRRKLLDPKAKPGKRHEWQTELVQADLAIQEIELKLC